MEKNEASSKLVRSLFQLSLEHEHGLPISKSDNLYFAD